MNRNTGMNAGQIIGTMSGRQVVGLDIAKQVFQLHTVDMGTGEIIPVFQEPGAQALVIRCRQLQHSRRAVLPDRQQAAGMRDDRLAVGDEAPM